MVQRHQPDDSDVNEDRIRDALRRLDEVWVLFTGYTVAALLYQLIARVTLQPDGMCIKMNVPALIRQIREMAELSVATEDAPENVATTLPKPV